MKNNFLDPRQQALQDEILEEMAIKEELYYGKKRSLNEMSPPPKVDYSAGDPIHIRYDHEGQTTYYFKVYKEEGRDNITKLSRISLISPKYEPPHDHTPPLVLKDWEVDWLIEKLKSKPKKKNAKEATLLEYIINELNKHNKGLKNGFIIKSNIKPSNYEALKGTRPPRS